MQIGLDRPFRKGFLMKRILVCLAFLSSVSAYSSPATVVSVDEKTEAKIYEELTGKSAALAGRVTCCYVDAGWEEHGGGHCETGLIAAVVSLRAKEECMSFHDSCTSSGCKD